MSSDIAYSPPNPSHLPAPIRSPLPHHIHSTAPPSPTPSSSTSQQLQPSRAQMQTEVKAVKKLWEMDSEGNFVKIFPIHRTFRHSQSSLRSVEQPQRDVIYSKAHASSTQLSSTTTTAQQPQVQSKVPLKSTSVLTTNTSFKRASSMEQMFNYFPKSVNALKRGPSKEQLYEQVITQQKQLQAITQQQQFLQAQVYWQQQRLSKEETKSEKQLQLQQQRHRPRSPQEREERQKRTSSRDKIQVQIQKQQSQVQLHIRQLQAQLELLKEKKGSGGGSRPTSTASASGASDLDAASSSILAIGNETPHQSHSETRSASSPLLRSQDLYSPMPHTAEQRHQRSSSPRPVSRPMSTERLSLVERLTPGRNNVSSDSDMSRSLLPKSVSPLPLLMSPPIVGHLQSPQTKVMHSTLLEATMSSDDRMRIVPEDEIIEDDDWYAEEERPYEMDIPLPAQQDSPSILFGGRVGRFKPTPATPPAGNYNYDCNLIE